MSNITFVVQGTKLGNSIAPMHDFGFATIEALNYDEWYYQKKRYDLDIVDFDSFAFPAANVFPVGSVEFVQSYLKNSHGIDSVKPINIPEELDSFANRKIERRMNISSLQDNESKMVKSMTGIKKFCSIIDPMYGNNSFPTDDYIVSDIIDIQSEWRCFVYKGKLLDAKCYSFTEHPFQVPDISVVRDMIKAYDSSPVAYTLDVCVDNMGRTSILEVHNFFSCGLYGFNDYGNYLRMVIDGIRWEISMGKSN